jgi:hypothetical protein
VDARHPGLNNDIEAWRWLRSTIERTAIVATQGDKLARGERIRAMREDQSVFEDAVLPEELPVRSRSYLQFVLLAPGGWTPEAPRTISRGALDAERLDQVQRRAVTPISA